MIVEPYNSGNIILKNFVVEHGTDKNEENENGETPLFNACYSGNRNFNGIFNRIWSRYK